MAAFVTAITTKFISGLLVKAGNKAFDSALSAIRVSKKTRELYQAICEPDCNEDYARNVINRVFTFRTIINGDRDVFLDQIYHPLKLTSPNDDVLTVDDCFTLPEHTSSCLVGYAGQGKTITMKKMFLEDLNKDDFFPFFISLRALDFSKEASLPDVLLQHFKIHGVQSDLESVNNILKKIGKIRIYFDGFDEIHHDHRNNAIALLDECITMWKINVVCSSRPDTQICKKPGFVVYNVNFLEAGDVEEIININVHNPDAKSTLLTTLHGRDFLLESIKSPILVDIFIVTSTGLGKKPENIVNYYESLFSSLVYKHDFNKIFTRARKSDLTDTQMEQCLSYFAFIAQLKQQTNFAYSDLVEAFVDAKSIIGKEDEDEKKIIEDVIEITNLITRDGYDNYTFIHKSIQDFYAAKFISSSTEENQIEFFNEINNLRPDLNFCYMLKSLMPASYYPYFIKGKIESLEFGKSNPIYPTTEDALAYIENWEILLDKGFDGSADTYKIVGVIRSDSEREKYPFLILDEISELMFISQGDYNPVSAIFNYWTINKMDDDNFFMLIHPFVKVVEEYGQDTYEIEIKDFINLFPDFINYIQKVVDDTSILIDKIFENYDAAMSRINSKNTTTQRMIKGLMQAKKIKK